MQSKKRLVLRIHELLDSSAQLRDSLQQYERTMKRIADRLEEGEEAIAAARGTSIPAQRRRVTEAIEEFEAARHQLRLALMVAGRAEGASMAEVGRVLGISRQLAARLAAEAATDPEH
jgi:hypothetical protein